MNKENDGKLDALKSLVEKQEENEVTPQNEVKTEVIENESKPGLLDGYKRIDKSLLPQNGELYPESWQFAYRCPTAKEIANFSTVNEMDQPGIIVAVEELIRKCVVIFDTEQQKRINTGEICDGQRTFLLLLIRDFYLPDTHIEFNSVCQTCHEQYNTHLTADKLEYPELKDKLLSAYDGRIFTLQMGPNVEVKFRVPTLETTGRIFRHIVKAYRTAGNGGEEKKDDKLVFDKQFLLVAPYLFVTGNETMRDIQLKYKSIIKNEELFKAYLTIINKLKLDNEETFTYICPECGSEEETLIKFPGGWKKLFVSKTDTTGYFD